MYYFDQEQPESRAYQGSRHAVYGPVADERMVGMNLVDEHRDLPGAMTAEQAKAHDEQEFPIPSFLRDTAQDRKRAEDDGSHKRECRPEAM